eukprot:12744934-Prorocentrum_lima.AAC.1
MTSSLVGSEMCIRDRNWRSDTIGWTDIWTGRGLASGHCWLCSVSPQTVSYTHLTLPTICSV